MKLALDTNVLAYAEGVNGADRQARAADLIAALPLASVVVPVQVLGELHRVLARKARRPAAEARAAVLAWQDAFPTRDTTAAALASAMDLSADHGLSIWDAVILAVSAEAGCRLLLTEDLQDGFTWRGVTVTNPFADRPHPLLLSILDQPDQPDLGSP